MTFLLALVALISAFGSSFQYGYNVSVINSPAPYMQDFYNRTYFNRTGVPMDSGFQTLLWSLTVSMYPLGGLFGSLMVWPMVNNCGRKGTLLINNLFSITAAILMGTSEIAKTFEVIILSRVIMGIYAGLASNVVPMFLGEISPKNLRGAMGIVPQLFISIGILVAQIFGLSSILGNVEGWPVLLGLTGIPSLIQLLILPFFPESPRYLLLQKDNEEEARQALQRLRGWDDVDDEIEEMRQEDRSEKEEGHFTVLSLCTFRGLRWQLISIIVMMMGQQLSGVNAVFYYADRIFQSAGVDGNNVQYVTVSIGAINVVMTLLAVFIVESLGRRVLLLAGFGLCCVSCAVLTLALNLQIRPRKLCDTACLNTTSSTSRSLNLLHPFVGDHCLMDVLPQHSVRHCVHHRTCYRSQSNSLSADHGDVPAVIPACCVHGGWVCALDMQLHRGTCVPLHGGWTGGLQLPHLLCHLPRHYSLHLHYCS
ncbi:solute carrier family 2, facilitated glucose transporter member 5 isoform X4 [Larus michahellis]